MIQSKLQKHFPPLRYSLERSVKMDGVRVQDALKEYNGPRYEAYVLIEKAGYTIQTLQNNSGLTIQITRDANAKNGYSTKTSSDVHDADATNVSSSGGHTSNAPI